MAFFIPAMYFNAPCAKTNSATNPWWAVDMVDLGVALYVVGVKFTNREGYNMVRINQSISQENVYRELKN